MTIFQVFIILLFGASSSWVEIYRQPADYKAGKSQDENYKICHKRYSDELKFTRESILPGLPKECGIDQSEFSNLQITLANNSIGLPEIARNYQKLMALLDRCRMQVLLAPSANTDALKAQFGANDDKTRNTIFLHVLGDAFAEHTGLEGSDSSVTLAHRIRLLKTIRERISTNKAFINDKDHAQPCHKIEEFKSFYTPDYPHYDLPDQVIDQAIEKSELAKELYELSRAPSLLQFRDKLLDAINKLEPGQSIYFPSSWSGHAIVFELVKEDQSHISFKMFNSGDGISQYHDSSVVGAAIKYAPYVKQIKVPIKNMTSLVTLSALKEVYQPKGKSTKPSDFYEIFMPLLGGVEVPFSKEPQSYKKTQLGGTCSYTSLPWVMSSCLAQNIAKSSPDETNIMSARLEDMVDLVTLSEFAQIFEKTPKMQQDENIRALISKGLVHKSSRLIDGLAEKSIANSELIAVVKTLTGIRKAINKAEDDNKEVERKSITQFEGVQTESGSYQAFDALPDVISMGKIFVGAGGSKTSSLAKPLGPADLDKDPTKIRIVSEYGALSLGKTYFSKDFVLPHLSDEEAFNLTDNLAFMAQGYLGSLLKDIARSVIPEQKISIEQILTAVTFLTVADLVNQYHFKMLPSLYSKTWGDLLFGDSAVVTIRDPQWQQHFLWLKRYWQDRKQQSNFFGFETIPTGSFYSPKIYDDASAAQEIKLHNTNAKRWEDSLSSFADLGWGLQQVDKVQDSDAYSNWAKNQEFSPFEFEWRGYSRDREKPNSNDAPISRTTPENLKRRAALLLISGADLPFLKEKARLFNLSKILAIVPDYLLTGDLSLGGLDANKIDFGRGIKITSSDSGTDVSEALYSSGDGEFTYKKSTYYNARQTVISIFGFTKSDYSSINKNALNAVRFPVETVLFNTVKPQYYLSRHQGSFDVFGVDYDYKEQQRSFPKTGLISVFNAGFGWQLHINNLNRRRLTPNTVIERSPGFNIELQSFTLENLRALYNLSSVARFQLDKTLSYFLYRPHLLGRDNEIYRSFFERLMFDQGLMTEEFSKAEKHKQAFAKRLAQFTAGLRDYFVKDKDLKGLVFIARMNDLFELYARRHDAQADGFFDARSFLLESLLDIPADHYDEKSFIYQNLALLHVHRPVFSAGDAFYLLLGVVGHRALKIQDKQWIDQELEEAFQDVLARRNDELKKIFFNNKEIDTSLNLLIRAIDSKLWSKDRSWKSLDQSLIFETLDEPKLKIDIQHGDIYQNGNKISSFPLTIAEYQRVFGMKSKPPAVAAYSGLNIFEWDDPASGHTVRVKLDVVREKNNRYARKIDGEWFYLLNEQEVSLIKENQAIVPTHHNWLSGKQIFVSNLDGQQEIEVSLQGKSPQTIVRKTDGSTLVPSTDPIYKIFSALESVHHIYAWKNSGNEIVEVSLPRLKLSFKLLPGKNKLDCASITGYQVALDQYVSDLGLPKNYLVCEPLDSASNTTKKILMVAQKPKSMAEDAGLRTTHMQQERQELDFNHDFSGNVVLYQLKDEKIEPENSAARYYLALRKLWQQRYREANELLAAEASDLGKLSAQEKEIIAWIIGGTGGGAVVYNDSDVRSLAVRLNALYLELRDYRYHNENPDGRSAEGHRPHYGDMLGLYKNYLKRVNVVGSNLLRVKTELSLLDWLKDSGSSANAMENRREYLRSIYDGTEPTTQRVYFHDKPSSNNKEKFIVKKATIEQLKSYYKGPGSEILQTKWKETTILNLDASDLLKGRQTFINLCNALRVKVFSYTELLKNYIGSSDELKNLTLPEQRFEIMQLIRRASLYTGRGNEISARVAQTLLDIAADPAAAKGDRKCLKLSSYLANSKSKDEELEKWYNSLPSAERFLAEYTPQSSSYPSITPLLPRKIKNRSFWRTDFDTNMREIADPLKDPVLLLNFKQMIFEELTRTNASQDSLNSAYQQIQSKLKNAMSNKGISSDVRAGIKNIDERLIGKYRELLTHSKQFKVKDWQKLTEFNDWLAKDLSVSTDKQVSRSKEILDLARKYDPTQPDANRYELLKLADIEREVTLEDTIYLLLTNKLEQFYVLNGSLTVEEAKALRNLVVDYLIVSTVINHTENIREKTAQLLSLQGKPEDDADVNLVTQELASLLSVKRAYEIGDHPEYLVFEYFNKKLMRESQKMALDTLAIKDGQLGSAKHLGQVIELIMGAGKTSFILPLLSAMVTDKQWLNVVVLPESLITSMAQELSATMSTSFKKHIDIVLFGRDKKLNKYSIPILKQRLIEAKKEGRTIVTTNSSLQSLFLSLIAEADTGPSYPPDDQSLPGLKGIFKLFKDFGHLIIDEVDLALDVMRAQQIAAGQKIAISDTLKDTVSSLYLLMSSDPDIYGRYALPFLPYAEGQALNSGSFPALKQALIKKMLNVKDERSFLRLSSELDQLFTRFIKTHGPEQIKSYWQKPTANNRKNLFDLITDVQLKDVMAIIAEELNGTLELTAVKKLNIHYGPLPEPKITEGVSEDLFKLLFGEYQKSRFIAIPYYNGVPLVRSRSARAIEQVNYTIQKDLSSDNYKDYVELELAALKKIGSGSARFAALYRKLVGDKFSSIHVFDLTDQNIQSIADSYKGQGNGLRQLRFIKNHALSQIAEFEKQLSTNAQIYEFMFRMVQGFAGALWSFQTFPDMFGKPHLSDTSPLTILTLLSQPASVRSINPGNLLSLVQQIYAGWSGSLIDEGGILRGYANKDVASAIMDQVKASGILGVIFYDETDNIVIMDNNGLVMPLSKTSIPRDKQIAYWDKQHTTGSDLKLSSRMQAKMTIDRHLKLRDVEQASWRLRQLAQGQRIVEYIALEQDLKTMASTLRTKYGLSVEANSFTPADVMVYSIINQQELLSFLNWRAFGQRMKNKLIKESVEDVFDPEKETYGRYKNVADLFALSKPRHLHDIYGQPVQKANRDDAIKQEKAQLVSYKAYKEYNREGKLDKTLESIIERDKSLLPDQVRVTPNANQGTEVEVELNLQTRTQTQTQMQTFQFNPNKRGPSGRVRSWDLPASGELVFGRQFFEQITNSTNALRFSTQRCAKTSGKALEALFNAIDQRIYFSANFAPLDEVNFEFFDQYAKELNDVLLIFDKERNEYSLVIIDLNDVDQWKEFLLKDQENASSEERQLAIGIYNLLSNKLIAQDSQGFDEQVLSQHDSLIELLAQVKFMGGVLAYTDKEKVKLKEWLERYGLSELRDIFKRYIMSYKDESMKEYDTSFLAEIFDAQ